MERIKKFCKNEIILLVSFVLAAVSAFAVRPDNGYADYIDFRTLALLFCLMTVMAGLKRMGVFRTLAQSLLKRTNTFCGLCLILCLLCFFSSMLITNDVALITFVPFSLITLRLSGKTEKMIPLITLETVAANLGSMVTPIGNPQNLFLFSAFNMSAAEFFPTILPYGALSLVLVIASAFFMGKGKSEIIKENTDNERHDTKKYVLYGALFLLALLTVFRIIPYPVVFAVTLISVLFFDRQTLKKVDYSLLATFVFLFIFIGNLGRIEPVREFLSSIITSNEVPVGILASQVFSNVPAAVLLAGFTKNAGDLLIGINLGGLGTLIASMASLISFKFISRERISKARYLLIFTIVNVVFLAVNLALWAIIR